MNEVNELLIQRKYSKWLGDSFEELYQLISIFKELPKNLSSKQSYELRVVTNKLLEENISISLFFIPENKEYSYRFNNRSKVESLNQKYLSIIDKIEWRNSNKDSMMSSLKQDLEKYFEWSYI